MDGQELLSVQQMGEADRVTIEAGTPGYRLMLRAGAGIASVIRRNFELSRVIVACGPGNNGGDGFVVARILADAGWPVSVVFDGDPKSLKGDARLAAEDWTGPVEAMTPETLDDHDMLVDALFGAGLGRPIDGTFAVFLAAAKEMVAAGVLSSVAVDVPSGVDGNSGQVRGLAVPAAHTVTFFSRKPGHLLMPGRELAGAQHLVDIGIKRSVLEDTGWQAVANHPTLWQDGLPSLAMAGHKYHRGHLLVAGGETMTGAARLAALAARRVGAGLVTLSASEDNFTVYASDHPGTIVSTDPFSDILADERKNVVLVGPGAGVSSNTEQKVRQALAAGRTTVLDADAISVFEGRGEELTQLIKGPIVLTPHSGEFFRLFPDLKEQSLDKVKVAGEAARRLGAIVVLKGPDTVIAGPDVPAVINENAPPTLATGGTGDVLAGMVAGLLAQGMPAFDAACAAVWLHGDAGTRAGEALVTEDLLTGIAAGLNHLRRNGPMRPVFERLPLVE